LAGILAYSVLTSGGCATDSSGGGPDTADIPGDEARPARGNGNLQALVIDDSRCQSSGKRVSQVDLNHDDFADLITLYQTGENGETVGCKQADLNFDGRLDAFYYYGPEGEIDREQFDLDFDGRIDLGRYFEAEIVIKDEQDLDLDGAVDTWRFYDKGRIVRMETDRDADGRADMFTYYVREEIDRIGYDINGDGKADQWDHDAARRARIAIEKRKDAQAPPPGEEPADEDTVEEPSETTDTPADEKAADGTATAANAAGE
jgi:hypothetical protein